jgi:hypothetical protein
VKASSMPRRSRLARATATSRTSVRAWPRPNKLFDAVKMRLVTRSLSSRVTSRSPKPKTPACSKTFTAWKHGSAEDRLYRTALAAVTTIPVGKARSGSLLIATETSGTGRSQPTTACPSKTAPPCSRAPALRLRAATADCG